MSDLERHLGESGPVAEALGQLAYDQSGLVSRITSDHEGWLLSGQSELGVVDDLLIVSTSGE
jgi:hypothetical protein